MKILSFGLLFVLLLCISTAKAETSTACDVPFSATLTSGAILSVESRSSEVKVVGVEGDRIRVTCKAQDSYRTGEIQIHYKEKGSQRILLVEGGPSNNVQIRIEVPVKTNLRIHMPAGAVNIDRVQGDKKIDLYAGEIQISNVSPKEYHSVSASVRIGDVRSTNYGIDKGGFFRGFSRDSGMGPYHLFAHVTTGSIYLN